MTRGAEDEPTSDLLAERKMRFLFALRTRGVTDIAARSTALTNPVCSATPSPSIATRTTPSGGKLVNVPTIFDLKLVSDAPPSWLLTCSGCPVRGSISVKLTPDSHQLTSQAATISSRGRTRFEMRILSCPGM